VTRYKHWYTHVYTRIRKCASVYTIYTRKANILTREYTYLHIYLQIVCTRIHVRTRCCVYTCIYVYTHIYTGVCIQYTKTNLSIYLLLSLSLSCGVSLCLLFFLCISKVRHEYQFRSLLRVYTERGNSAVVKHSCV